MIKLRSNVFETNSSSTHSIVIVGDYRYLEALQAVDPDIAEELKSKLKDKYYNQAEIEQAFKNIGATLVDGVLDLSQVSPEHFDFGYTGPTTYADPAHKLLLALTIFEFDDSPYSYDYYDQDYYRNMFKDILHEMSINDIVRPKEGFTGIDHQCRDRLEDQVRYDLRNFILRKDYVLFLDHD